MRPIDVACVETVKQAFHINPRQWRHGIPTTLFLLKEAHMRATKLDKVYRACVAEQTVLQAPDSSSQCTGTEKILPQYDW